MYDGRICAIPQPLFLSFILKGIRRVDLCPPSSLYYTIASGLLCTTSLGHCTKNTNDIFRFISETKPTGDSGVTKCECVTSTWSSLYSLLCPSATYTKRPGVVIRWQSCDWYRKWPSKSVACLQRSCLEKACFLIPKVTLNTFNSSSDLAMSYIILKLFWAYLLMKVIQNKQKAHFFKHVYILFYGVHSFPLNEKWFRGYNYFPWAIIIVGVTTIVIVFIFYIKVIHRSIDSDCSPLGLTLWLWPALYSMASPKLL